MASPFSLLTPATAGGGNLSRSGPCQEPYSNVSTWRIITRNQSDRQLSPSSALSSTHLLIVPPVSCRNGHTVKRIDSSD